MLQDARPKTNAKASRYSCWPTSLECATEFENGEFAAQVADSIQPGRQQPLSWQYMKREIKPSESCNDRPNTGDTPCDAYYATLVPLREIWLSVNEDSPMSDADKLEGDLWHKMQGSATMGRRSA